MIRHVHCMWKQHDQNHDRLGGKIPPVCSSEPLHKSGFCKEHGELVVNLGWPSQLREFLLKCGTNPDGFNKESAKRVDDKLTELSQLADSQPGGTTPDTPYTKTTSYFLRSNAITADDFNADIPSDDDKCNKVHNLIHYKSDIII